MYQDFLSFFGKDEVIKFLGIGFVFGSLYQSDGTVNGDDVLFRIDKFDGGPFALQVFRDIIQAHPYFIGTGCNLVVGCSSPGLEFRAVFLQFFKIGLSVLGIGNQGPYGVFGGSRRTGIRHDNLAFPFGIQKIIPGLGRFFFGNLLRIVGNPHIHHPGTGIIAFLINKYRIDGLGFRRTVFLKDAHFLKTDVVGRIPYPDYICRYLAGFRFRGDFRNNFPGSGEVVIQFDVRVFLFKRFLHSIQLVFLHRGIQHHRIPCGFLVLFGTGNRPAPTAGTDSCCQHAQHPYRQPLLQIHGNSASLIGISLPGKVLYVLILPYFY